MQLQEGEKKVSHLISSSKMIFRHISNQFLVNQQHQLPSLARNQLNHQPTNTAKHRNEHIPINVSQTLTLSHRPLTHTHSQEYAQPIRVFFYAVLIFMSSFNSSAFYSWALSALLFINIIRTMSAEPLKKGYGYDRGSVNVCVYRGKFRKKKQTRVMFE